MVQHSSTAGPKICKGVSYKVAPSKQLETKTQSYSAIVAMRHHFVKSGADPGFDQGGPQIVTGLKLPFWGLSFVEF